jgi:putative hemolysin
MAPSLTDLRQVLRVQPLEGEESPQFSTVGGFKMAGLRHVPREGGQMEWSGYRFEVVVMDGRRVEQVLVHPISADLA